MAEGLQIAQMMADLQTLQNADPKSASQLLAPPSSRPALLSSKSTPAVPTLKSTSSHKHSHSLSKAEPQTQQARLDKLGRRIVIPKSGASTPVPTTRPDISRNTSSFGKLSSYGTDGRRLSGVRSGYATPVEEANPDPDLHRAKILLALSEMRGDFKRMGDTGLSRSKQRVDAVVNKYEVVEVEDARRGGKGRYLGV